MGTRSGADADADAAPRRSRRADGDATAAGRPTTEVACPHPDCGRTATAPAPTAATELRVTRRSSYLGTHEETRCRAGHRVFVHYCRTH
jgi:hypothetical protein